MSAIKMPSALKKRPSSHGYQGGAAGDNARQGSSQGRRPGPSHVGSVDRLPSFYAGGVRQNGNQGKQRSGPQRSTKALGKLKILPDAGAPDQHRGSPIVHLSTESQRGSGDEESSDDDVDQEDHDELAERHAQLSQIPEGSMRRDARRLTRKARASLPRVTAYSTATSYRMRELTKWLQARKNSHRTNAMTFDECVYSTYTYELINASHGTSSQLYGVSNGRNEPSYHHPQRHHHSNKEYYLDSPRVRARTGDLLGIPELSNEYEAEDVSGSANGNRSESTHASSTTIVDHQEDGSYAQGHIGDVGEENEETRLQREQAEQEAKLREEQRRREEARRKRKERFLVRDIIPEIFVMEYGTIVIWGMTEVEERRFLRELKRFEVERLSPEDIESEDLNWYLADYSRIYNDVITLRRGSSYMTKLSLSHALAQSTKISFFEGVIENTIDATKGIPQSIAESGKIGMPPADIMKQIGHLFILRMNIHLVGSIVDSPEIFWAQPDLEPLYSAARSYLEIPQRIDLLNARVEVLQDMLQLLKDQVSSSHSEWLEIIVIVLIVLEIILGVATMIVDLYFA
ncbi:DUF155-domain-containing protein [Tilletiaria anomala UBC 951]|uniref:DUF155-domain-containing protein n=1 Tax=Tilletiaria anomala (strain ATCC 24038 / CBS 436.72 / UBC 951) TaxID=1037660 RepID=A0A066VSG0_TILAU|nr:DUF155-domain-containing protein [Tilletiaria anomala UBC 951]KDN44376.1 DUF155-domain-containing protein [Tilletiaria anomala UBC 951]